MLFLHLVGEVLAPEKSLGGLLPSRPEGELSRELVRGHHHVLAEEEVLSELLPRPVRQACRWETGKRLKNREAGVETWKTHEHERYEHERPVWAKLAHASVDTKEERSTIYTTFTS